MSPTNPFPEASESSPLVVFLQRVRDSWWFNNLILVLIIFAGLLAGLETYPSFESGTPAGRVAASLQDVILWIFLVEALIRIGSYGKRPWRYFLSGWNVLDFLIIVICFLPIGAQFAAVFRMARLLRTIRLVTLLPRLQVLVAALLRAIPSLGYVGGLLFLHFYVYAVAGTYLFGRNDPIRFGTLHETMLTLFQVLTLEGWNDVLSTQYLGSDVAYDDSWKALTTATRQSSAQPVIASFYFVSFIFIGTMIMLNLFTGVIISSMEEAQGEAAERVRQQHLREEGLPTVQDELQSMSEQLHALSQQLLALKNASGDWKVKTEVPVG
jgi:voltage-gated sodium channel